MLLCSIGVKLKKMSESLCYRYKLIIVLYIVFFDMEEQKKDSAQSTDNQKNGLY